MNWLKNNPLLAHASLMFAGTMVAHICNLGYQMTVSRILPPKEYALLMAFLGILMILSRPMMTLSTSINHFVSLMAQDNQFGQLVLFIRKWVISSSIPGLLIGGLLILTSQNIADYFHLERTAPVIVTGIIVPVLFVAAVLSGATLGLQRFKLAALSIILGAIGRVLLGAVFVYFIFPAAGWALLGHGASAYISTGILVSGLMIVARKHTASEGAMPAMRNYMLQSLVIQFAYAFLMTADIVMVKHLFPENETFAYAATIGRMAAFLPAAIAMAMFPKVAGRKHATGEQRHYFRQSLILTLIASSSAFVFCLLVPRLPLYVLFGITNASANLILQTQMMSGAMTLSAVLNTLVMFLLAQRHFSAAAPVVLCALGYALAVYSGLTVSINSIIILCIGMNMLALLASATLSKRWLR